MYIVYKTTNTINNYIYVGVHKEKLPNDSYLGSGKLLKRAIKKYGSNAFIRETLYTFPDKSSAYEMERCIVDDIFIRRVDTYNINSGGDGGFDYINNNKEYFVAKRKETVDLWSEQKRLNVNSKKACLGSANGMYGSSRFGEANPMYGKHHSDETRMKIGTILKTKYDNGLINPRKGSTLSEEHKENIAKRNSKTWDFMKNGGVIQINNLEKFCRDNTLNPLCMARVSCGKQKAHKGYTRYDHTT